MWTHTILRIHKKNVCANGVCWRLDDVFKVHVCAQADWHVCMITNLQASISGSLINRLCTNENPTLANIHSCMHIYIYIPLRTHIHAYIHIYIHTYTYTHVQTAKYQQSLHCFHSVITNPVSWATALRLRTHTHRFMAVHKHDDSRMRWIVYVVYMVSGSAWFPLPDQRTSAWVTPTNVWSSVRIPSNAQPYSSILTPQYTKHLPIDMYAILNSKRAYMRTWLTSQPPPRTSADVWLQIGHIHELQKNFAVALEGYQNGLKEDSNHAKLMQHIAWLKLQDTPFQVCVWAVMCVFGLVHLSAYTP